jgi:MFS family permease
VPQLRASLASRPPGYEHSVGRVLAVYSALMAALFLAALDQTVLATALPAVVSDLGGVTSYSWPVTAYLLATAVCAPLWGKLADVHGRRRLLLGAIAVFVGASAACACAGGMTQLVAFRAVQGVGGGGIFSLVLASIGAAVPPRERGRYQGFAGATVALAAIGGPALGGLLVDHAGWRWIFVLNAPLGAAALALIAVALPADRPARARSVDWPGAVALGSAGAAATTPGPRRTCSERWGRRRGSAARSRSSSAVRASRSSRTRSSACVPSASASRRSVSAGPR